MVAWTYQHNRTLTAPGDMTPSLLALKGDRERTMLGVTSALLLPADPGGGGDSMPAAGKAARRLLWQMPAISAFASDHTTQAILEKSSQIAGTQDV